MYKWKHNRKCEQPELLCFVDTETTENPCLHVNACKHLRLKLGVARFGRWNGSNLTAQYELVFSDASSFWNELSTHWSGKKVVWVFAHNIMFDLWVLGFPEMIQNGQINLSRCVEESTGGKKSVDRSKNVNGKKNVWRGFISIDKGCTILKVLYNRKRYNFVDTYNYFPMSVYSLGNSIGMQKLDRPESEDQQERLLEYCRRDVEIIQIAITSLMRAWKINDLGNWQATIPSLAYSAYRHRFMHRAIVCHNDHEATKHEHSAYYPGRVEPFFLGRIPPPSDLFIEQDSRRPLSPVYALDINSLYPSVMVDQMYPVEAVCGDEGRPFMYVCPSIDWLQEQIDTYLCIALCLIETNTPIYPARIDGRVCYPVGRFWTTLCTPEVKMAIDRRHLRRCHIVTLYHRWPIFREWVQNLWAAKEMQERLGNLAMREVYKLLLNSIVGKMAQKRKYWVNTNRWPCEDMWTSWTAVRAEDGLPISLRSIGRQVQMMVDDGWERHALVAVSAHVNSYARVKMVCDIETAGKRNVYYIGNDSIMVSQAGYDALSAAGRIAPNELGGYRVVGTYNDICIYGPNDYEVDGCVKKAGLPKINKRIGHRRWEVWRFEGSHSLISRPPDGSVHMYRDIVTSGYPHTQITTDRYGWVVPRRVIK